MSYSAQKMPSLPITSSLHLHLSTPAGSWGWEATCFPCIWSWGNGEMMSPFCDILPTSLPIVALLLHSQSPSLTSQGGDSHPSATQKAQLQFPTVISMCICRLPNLWTNAHHPTRWVHLTPQSTQRNYCSLCKTSQERDPITSSKDSQGGWPRPHF